MDDEEKEYHNEYQSSHLEKKKGLVFNDVDEEDDKPSHFIWVLPYLNMQVEWQSSPAVVLGNELNSFVSTPISLLQSVAVACLLA